MSPFFMLVFLKKKIIIQRQSQFYNETTIFLSKVPLCWRQAGGESSSERTSPLSGLRPGTLFDTVYDNPAMVVRGRRSSTEMDSHCCVITTALSCRDLHQKTSRMKEERVKKKETTTPTFSALSSPRQHRDTVMLFKSFLTWSSVELFYHCSLSRLPTQPNNAWACRMHQLFLVWHDWPHQF